MVVQGLSPAVALACLGATVAAGACASRAAPVQPAAAGATTISYTQIEPIFRERCEHCHNEDKGKGGLLMTSFEALAAGGESGPAFLAGHSGKSLLVEMIEGTLTPRMPYKEDPLSDAEIALIRRWIDAGAPGPAASPASAAGSREVVVPVVKPTVPVAGAAAAVAFDPSTGRLVVGGYKTAHVMALNGRTWERRLDGHADLVRAVAFSPDGTRLAVAGGPSGQFGEVKVWDLTASEPKPVTTIKGHADTILAVAFAPDGATIASASYDKLVKLWDAATGAERATLKEHSDAVYAVAFAPGGRHVLSAAGDRTIKVWDVSTGKRLLTIGDPLDAVYSLAVHPSGERIAAAGADRMIRTWALNMGAAPPSATLTASMFAHGDAVLGLAYTPDGSTLVSAGADRVIKVWDAATLREKQLLEPQPDWVLALALSRDGRWLAAGRYDGTVGLYGFPSAISGEHFVVPR